MSSTPQSEPKEPMVSYSGPPYSGSISQGAPAWTTFLQRTAQAQQASIPLPILASMSSALMGSAPAKLPSRKLRVGRLPVRTPPSSSRPVPAACNPAASSPLRTPSAIQRASARIASPSCKGTGCVPRAATALSFFAPITAPRPVRPAASLVSFMMQA